MSAAVGESSDPGDGEGGDGADDMEGDRGGLVVGKHIGALTGYVGVYVLSRAGRVTVSAPVDLVPRLVRQASTAATSLDDLLTPGWWRRALPGWVVLGPSVHAFLDASVTLAPTAPGVEEATGARVATALRHRVTAAEWEESGFADAEADAGGRAWLARDGAGRPVAAAHLTLFDGVPADIGVVVAGDSRGQGYGRATAVAATGWAVDHHGIARWRALETNRASRALASSVGFVDDCRQLAVRPPSSSTI